MTKKFLAIIPENSAPPALEGMSLVYQPLELRAGGPVQGAFALGNGLLVRIGNATTGCP